LLLPALLLLRRLRLRLLLLDLKRAGRWA
jgi:hypothetical protein